MKKRIRQAAVRIALLREEYSEEEWEQAVRYLEENSIQDRLKRFILNGELPKEADLRPRSPSKGKSEEPRLPSEQLLRVKDSDPERFTLLSDFERQLWEKRILPSIQNIRHLGLSLSKGFRSGKSRKDAVSSLISELLTLPLEKIKLVMKAAVERSVSGERDFKNLADFIIHGNQSSGEGASGQSE